MPDPDIHDRLNARLEELRRTAIIYLDATSSEPIRLWCSQIVVGFDMAIDNVRRKCPRCEDKGFYYRSGRKHALKEDCDCNRPALLAEWERRLGGKG